MFEKIEIIRRLLGTLVVAIGSLGCAFHLCRLSRGKTGPVPVITLVIIGSTALVTGLQFVFPEVLTALRRNREALLAGEWWRLVTPLFVHAYGWWHACVNGVAAIIFCPLAERLYGEKLWALYFVPGVVGQIFGYLWSPDTAGSSLGIAGVIGGLFRLCRFASSRAFRVGAALCHGWNRRCRRFVFLARYPWSANRSRNSAGGYNDNFGGR